MTLFYPHSYYSYVILCNYYHYHYDHHHCYHYHYYYYYCYHYYYCGILLITTTIIIIIAITIMMMMMIYIYIYLLSIFFLGGYTMSCYTHFFTVSSQHFPLSWWNPRWPGGALVRDAGALLSPCRWRSQEGGTFWKKHHEISGRLWGWYKWYKWYKWYLKMINSDNSNMFMLYLCTSFESTIIYIYTHVLICQVSSHPYSYSLHSSHLYSLHFNCLHLPTLLTSLLSSHFEHPYDGV